MSSFQKQNIVIPASHGFHISDDEEILIRAAVIDALERAKAAPGEIEEVMALLEQGRHEEAIQLAGQAGGIRIADAIAAAYVTAGRKTNERLEYEIGAVANVQLTIGFDQSHDRAVAYMQNDRLRLITEFTDQMRDATRAALTDGIERGLNPVAQARQFRDSIGLTEFQERSVHNFRDALNNASTRPSDALGRDLRDRRFDPSIRRAADSKIPLTDVHKDRMVARYRERLLDFRTRMIARTEALRATHAGIHESFRQAVDGGHLSEDEIKRAWDATRDRRTRFDHAAVHGQERGLNEDFLVGGSFMRYPCDPKAPARQVVQCRCGIDTTIMALEAA